MDLVKNIILGFMAYLLGSVPCGVLIARLYRIDIHQVGSKNPGATNVLRSVGKKPALFTLLGDITKGVTAVWLGKCFLSSQTSLAAMGLLAIIGHNWPIFAKFQGGKGVATSLGVFLVLTPLPMLIVVLIWLAAVAIFRYVSLGSILAGLFLPLLVYLFYGPGPLVFSSLAAGLLLIYRHKTNIQRLLQGTENKLGCRRAES